MNKTYIGGNKTKLVKYITEYIYGIMTTLWKYFFSNALPEIWLCWWNKNAGQHEQISTLVCSINFHCHNAISYMWWRLLVTSLVAVSVQHSCQKVLTVLHKKGKRLQNVCGKVCQKWFIIPISISIYIDINIDNTL